MAVPQDDRLRMIVDIRRSEIQANVENDLRALDSRIQPYSERLSRVGCRYNCNQESLGLARLLHEVGYECRWYEGEVTFRDQVMFGSRGTGHHWLMMEGTEGENVFLDLTIGYHLVAQGRIHRDLMRTRFDPLWGSPPDELEYTVHYWHVWDGSNWGLQNRLDPPQIVRGVWNVPQR